MKYGCAGKQSRRAALVALHGAGLRAGCFDNRARLARSSSALRPTSQPPSASGASATAARDQNCPDTGSGTRRCPAASISSAATDQVPRSIPNRATGTPPASGRRPHAAPPARPRPPPTHASGDTAPIPTYNRRSR
ncbi:hypothetical protein [Streptomyces antibioticus]|uniref:hypothetical protein n=1 Tax=Streptomyces antibioticus TaxID=1890 RepID=UPI00368EA38B